VAAGPFDILDVNFDTSSGYVTLNEFADITSFGGGTESLNFDVTGMLSGINLLVGYKNPTVVETVCAGSGSFPCLSPLATITATTPFITTAAGFPEITGTVNIQLDITTPANGRLATVDQGFQVAPEPSTYLLFGSALIGLAIHRRKR
jgi:hypothetical protein